MRNSRERLIDFAYGTYWERGLAEGLNRRCEVWKMMLDGKLGFGVVTWI